MHNGTPTPALKILVVAEDRTLARRLTQFLETVGYQVLQAADVQAALAAVEAAAPDILLLDSGLAGRANWELCRLLGERPTTTGRFTFLLLENPSESQIPEALEAGVDDFLALPVDFGELQSRLRAAARLLEFDRRAGQQSRVDEVTGLPSRPAFVDEAQCPSNGAAGAVKGSCVVLDLDYFARVRGVYGVAARDAALKAVVDELRHLRTGSELLGSLGGNRFCAMLYGANEAAAVAWAQRARQALASLDLQLGQPACHITASCGVSSCGPIQRAAQLLDKAVEALQTAKHMGRNCVVRWDEIGEATRESRTFGKLFERTVARDVMTPCTVLLHGDETAGQAADLLRRTRLDGIPVVDRSGKLLGLCTPEQLTAVAPSKREATPVASIMAADVRRFGVDEEFATLMNFFTQDPLSLAVVVDHDRALGMLNCDSLLALSQPVTADSLPPRPAYSDTSDYLVVADQLHKEADHAG